MATLATILDTDTEEKTITQLSLAYLNQLEQNQSVFIPLYPPEQRAARS